MLDARAGRHAVFGLLFFLSGAAALVYEQLWIRELQHVFGSTIHSITTVVAAYMGGLGLGAFVMGGRADRHSNPAFLYGLLELAIGAFGIISPAVFVGIGWLYLVIARELGPGLWAATAIKFVVSFAVMLVPTFLMGATLPVLTRAFAGAEVSHLRRELALFYGLNTVGGVVGCALAGYLLVEYVGLRASLLGTGLLNLTLGAAAVLLTRGGPQLVKTQDAEEAAPRQASEEARRLAVWLIAATAFASLLYEIAWTRVLVLVVGSSTYAFTTILACFLFGLGLGSLVAVGRGLDPEVLLARAALVQGAVAALASLLFPFFRVLPVYIISTLRIPSASPTALIALQSLALAVVIIPPAIGMGMAFPFLTELAARRAGSTGAETGRAYFANTMGSIAGAVVTGFVLIHAIGSERTLVLGVAVNAAAAGALLWRRRRERDERGLLFPVEPAPVVLGALGLLVALLTPSWSRRLLDRGPAIYGHDIRSAAALRGFLRAVGAEQLRYDEGWNATISVWRNGNHSWLKTNGKADASSVADMNTQVLLGLLPALAHPRPARALVIGFGSGTSVRTLADARGVDHIDVVEIERAVVRAAPLFADVNRDVLRDPRVRLIEDDARSALQLGGPAYDVIASEPSNPWVAGVASLYTPEFFGIVRSRLARDGVFAQWVQTYRVPVGVVAAVVANLRTVFPHVEIWFANESDLILVATNRPVVWDRARIVAHLDSTPATGRAMRDWLVVDRPSQLLGRFLLGDRGTAALASSARLRHSDDRPALEFVAARGLLAQGGSLTVFDSLLGVRVAVGDSLPMLAGWTLAPGEWQASCAGALPATARLALPMAERALALEPRNAERHGELGRVLFAQRKLREALPHLEQAVRERPRDARLLLLAGLASASTGDSAGGRALLEGARAAGGGDSVWATSALAEWAVGERDFTRAAVEAERALRGLHPTIATPFPGSLQTAVRRLAFEAPPDVAAPVMEEALRRRPAWDVAYYGGAAAYARWGGVHCARAAVFASQLPRFGWKDDEIEDLVRSCSPR